VSLLSGLFDAHLHAGPDEVPRTTDDLSLASAAGAAGMAGFVLKSHGEPTASRALNLMAQHPGLLVGGSVTLNRSVGGLNPAAVEWLARFAAPLKGIVWLPTKDAAHDRLVKRSEAGGGISLLEGGVVSEAALAVIRVVAAHDLVLGTAHVSPQEGLAALAAAKALGVRRMVVTHAAAPVCDYSEEQMRAAITLGARIEFCALNHLPETGGGPAKAAARRFRAPADLVALIRRLGADDCLLTSDLGQVGAPEPVSGFAGFLVAMREAGLTRSETASLAGAAPLALLRP
jgi:hypothetical protein